MKLNQLRKKHPKFIYKSYDMRRKGENLVLQFRFILEPNIIFTPKITIPLKRTVQRVKVENFVFHLGLIESISYWKATCPKYLIIEAGKLTSQQTNWWHNLFINGLGEFFYKNSLDFTKQDFLHIESNSPNTTRESIQPQKDFKLLGDLILIAGGKDSAVTLELLKKIPNRKGILMLNPTKAALDVAKITGYSNPIIVRRTIDPKLLELNRSGYLNGHTPFSAYLAFLGALVAQVYGYKNVIVANEQSANEENTTFHKLSVNHQYSKSYHFEKDFRQYLEKYLSSNINYFSFLRPLYDLAVSSIFAKYGKYHKTFRSCNVGREENIWCGECSKCASVYLLLFPFFPYKKMISIFGSDYFKREKLKTYFKRITGIEGIKPFECVGTREESILAIALAIRKYRSLQKPIPSLIIELGKKLGLSNNAKTKELERRILNNFSKAHFLPKEYEEITIKELGKS